MMQTMSVVFYCILTFFFQTKLAPKLAFQLHKRLKQDSYQLLKN